MPFTSPYPPGTRAAVEALLRDRSLTMFRIAERTGMAYSTVKQWNREAGIRTRMPKGLRVVADTPDLAGLDAALRLHIARQIAAFDARLRAGGGETDTAKVLRDLGGLKRLLDELRPAARQPDADGDADGGSPQDLAERRARLARRLAALADGPGAGAPGEPGA